MTLRGPIWCISRISTTLSTARRHSGWTSVGSNYRWNWLYVNNYWRARKLQCDSHIPFPGQPASSDSSPGSSKGPAPTPQPRATLKGASQLQNRDLWCALLGLYCSPAFPSSPCCFLPLPLPPLAPQVFMEHSLINYVYVISISESASPEVQRATDTHTRGHTQVPWCLAILLSSSSSQWCRRKR